MSGCDRCAECNCSFLTEEGALDSVLIGDTFICENCATSSEWESGKQQEARMLFEEDTPEFPSAASMHDEVPLHFDVGQYYPEDKKTVSVFIENELIVEIPNNLDSDEEERYILAEATRLVKNAIKSKTLRITQSEPKLVDDDYID